MSDLLLIELLWNLFDESNSGRIMRGRYYSAFSYAVIPSERLIILFHSTIINMEMDLTYMEGLTLVLFPFLRQ